LIINVKIYLYLLSPLKTIERKDYTRHYFGDKLILLNRELVKFYKNSDWAILSLCSANLLQSFIYNNIDENNERGKI